MIRFAAASLAILTLALSAPVSAQASEDDTPEWQVCNETSFIMRAAFAGQEADGMTSWGWQRFRPGECKSIKTKPDQNRYVYAESSPAHQGGIREWKGTGPFCVGDADFLTENGVECALQNLQTRKFMEISASEPVTRLVEPDDFGSRAETAGIQRLLRDAGYAITRIDGVSGRRTSRTLTQFFRDNKIQDNTTLSSSEKIDALEKVAMKKITEVGLTVCNSSTHTIWVATGHKHRNTWKSQGWWEIAPSECPQVVTESISKKDMHVFARQVQPSEEDDSKAGQDKFLRSAPGQTQSFCISDARFSALGRENCDESGYSSADFRKVSSEEDGVSITFSDQDFGDSVLSGLRR